MCDLSHSVLSSIFKCSAKSIYYLFNEKKKGDFKIKTLQPNVQPQMLSEILQISGKRIHKTHGYQTISRLR